MRATGLTKIYGSMVALSNASTVGGVLLIGVINNGLGLLNIPIEMQLIAKGFITIFGLTVSNREN